jgi:hypothetical protein
LACIVKQDKVIWERYTSTGRRIVTVGKGWRVHNGRQVVATAQLLKHTQPKTLSVFLSYDAKFRHVQLLTLVQAMKSEHFSGNLEISHRKSRQDIIHIDDVIMLLKSTK